MTDDEVQGPPARVLATSIAARQPLASVIEQARVVESLGYGAIWIPEVMGRDAVALCAVLGQHTETIGLATGIVPLPRRTPMQLAMAAVTAAECAPGRFTLGVGIGHRSTLGPGWEAPLVPSSAGEVERGLRVVRRLLEGEEIDGPQPIRLRGVHRDENGPPPLVLAGLSPGLMGVAARVADGAVLNWLTPRRCTELIAALREESERHVPAYAYIPACVTDDLDGAFSSLARQLAAYGALPAYAQSLARCGLGEGVADLVAGAAPTTGSAARRALEELTAVGDRETVAERLDEFRAAGVDVPILAPVPLPGEAAWASMIATWTELSPDASV